MGNWPVRRVSIPFKREGTCELRNPNEVDPITPVFQFPSNGKARVNISGRSGWETGRFVFQFPSNGKARVNSLENDEFHKVVRLFQFPSNGKARVNTEKSTNGIHEQRKFQFPFKREGTCELALSATMR